MGMDTARIRTVCTVFGFALFLVVNVFTLWGGYLPTLSADLQGSEALMMIFIPQTVALVGTLLAAALLTGYMASGASRILLVASSMALLGGTLMQLLASAEDSSYLLPLSGMAVGAGSAGVFMLWEMVLTSLDQAHAEIGLLVGSALFPLLYVVSDLCAHSVLYVLVPVFVVISCALLMVAYRTIDFETPVFQQSPRTFRENYRSVSAALLRPMLCVASIGFCSGILRSTAIADDATGALVNDLSMVGVVGSALLLLLLWRKLHIRFDLPRFYQVVFPFVAAGFVLLPFLGNLYHYLFAGVAYLLFSLVSILMMLSCAELSRSRQVHPAFIYGLFAGFVYLLMGVGSSVGSYVGSLKEFGVAQMAMIALLTIYLLSLVLFTSRARKNGDEGEVVVVENTKDLLSERCAALADDHELSPREAEIMELIVRGRDVPHIAASLFISENTVRSHCKSIYRKVDVHNKQELLSKIDETEVETGLHTV